MKPRGKDGRLLEVPVEIRFFEKVRKTETCWEWIGSKTTNGYGFFWKDGKRAWAHRASWEIFHKKTIPEGMEGCHKCDNRWCVNPEHIFIGTHKDNMQDCARKGRFWAQTHGAPAKGEKHGSSKLREKDIIDIRLSYNNGEHQSSIAERYGMHKKHIGPICRGKRWKHVPMPTNEFTDALTQAREIERLTSALKIAGEALNEIWHLEKGLKHPSDCLAHATDGDGCDCGKGMIEYQSRHALELLSRDLPN